MPVGVPYVTQARWFLLAMVFSGFFILSSQRIHMNIAIIAMVNWTDIGLNTSFRFCTPSDNRTNMSDEDGYFSWSHSSQAHVLASYFYGLALLQLPSELIAEKFKPQIVVLVGLLLSSISSLITPVSAKWSFGGIIYVQIIKAMGHAIVTPAFSVMLGKWIPTKKLVRFVAYGTSGIPIGAFITVLVSGLICSKPEYGWESVFYISGAIGISWCFLWFYLCCDMRFMPVLSTNNALGLDYPKKQLPVPVKAILSSKPFWGYVASGIASYWMIGMNLFVMPIYFRNVFNIEIEWNGLVSSFPNMLQAFLYHFSFTFLRKRTASKTAVRRFVASIGLALFATCVVLLTFVKCRSVLGILLMALGVGASGCSLAAISLIAVDMSPNYSGIVSGLMNTIGAIAGCGLPLMVGYFMEGARTDLLQWEKVFYAAAFVTFIGMILFMAYSSCEVQPWNNPSEGRTTFLELQNCLSSENNRKAPDITPSTSMKHQEGATFEPKPSTSGSSTVINRGRKRAPSVFIDASNL